MKQRASPGAYIVPTLMIAFGVAFAYFNRDVPARDMRMATPVTYGLILVAGGIAIRTFVGGPRDRAPFTAAALRRPVYLIVCTGLLLFGASWDFPIAAALFLAVSIWLLGYRRPLVVVPVTILFPLALYLGFTWVGVPLSSFWLKV